MPEDFGSKPGTSEYWPHAPLHRMSGSGVYFVTAGTFGKKHYFASASRLGVLCRGLISVCRDSNWQLETWAVFSNHYHFVAQAPPDSSQSLSGMLRHLHSRTAMWINPLGSSPGRQVWSNFWETQLTFQKSYLARLRYVHENPVKHGLVLDARKHPYCSATWLETAATTAQVRTLESFATDKLNVLDDFDVSTDWA